MSANANEWIAVCRVDDIPPLGARVVTRPHGTAVALFRTASDAVFALLDRCPHKGGPLSQGIVHGEQVTCPLHGLNIAFGNGCALPPDDGCTTVFSVARDGERVLLKRSELASLGVGDAPGGDAAGSDAAGSDAAGSDAHDSHARAEPGHAG